MPHQEVCTKGQVQNMIVGALGQTGPDWLGGGLTMHPQS
jgi:hypothetical protein